MLADNQLAITGSGWDPELLRLELGELKLSGFDLSLTGFGDLELKAQVAAIAASIKEWGWTSPALVGEDGGLIAGHARVLAARQLGIAEIPVMVAAGWSEAQKRAYVLADNQLAITGSGWDPELQRLELGELQLKGFDLSLTGFGDLELKDIMADRTGGLTDPDDAPAVPEHPVSQTGDLWLLGAKVTCPQCRKVTPLERAIRK